MLNKIQIVCLLLLLVTSCQLNKPTNLNTKSIIMKLTSPAFQSNSNLPLKYSCDGQRINPSLQITDVPAAAQSLALIMDDPDAPMGTFVHWLVWNIDPKTKQIDENILPHGAKTGTNSGKITGYYPPCPPSGTHHYIFKLYALDTMLNLTPNAGKDNLEQAMAGHILDYAELIGIFKR